MSAPAGQPGWWGCPQASAYLHLEAWKKELLFLIANTESKQGVGWAGFENHLIICTCSLPGDVTEREDRILTLRDQLTLTLEQQRQESPLMHTAQTEQPSSSLAPSLTPLPPAPSLTESTEETNNCLPSMACLGCEKNARSDFTSLES